MSLSPDEQKKYDLANQVAVSLSGLANTNIDRVRDVQSQPFTGADIDTRLQQRYGGNNPFQITAGGQIADGVWRGSRACKATSITRG
jgi:hypothetical protein